MRLLTVIALAIVLLISACRPSQGSPQVPTDPVDQTGSDAGSDDVDADDPPAHGDDAAPDAPAVPVLLGVSVHVEGFQGEADDRQKYMRHRQALVETADAAEAHGAVLSFELSAEFTAAMARWGDDFAALMASRGHAIGVHADIGGTPIPLEAFTHQLAERKAAIEAQGVTVTHVSGICSESDWVEAAIGAGFESATGIVEFCIKSIPSEHRPAGYEDIDTCTRPSECHVPAPADLFQRAHPWRTSTSDAWLHNEPTAPIVVVSGESGTSLPCLTEGPDVDPCVLDTSDNDRFLALLDAYEDVASPEVPTVLNISWSIGVPQPKEAADAFFASVEPAVTSGQVRWETLPQIAAHFPRAVVDDPPAVTDPDTPPPADLERDAVQVGDDRWWVRNPTSGAWLWVRTLSPAETPAGPLPVVVMVPGGANSAIKFLEPPSDGQAIADAGNVVVVFDPDGRGHSEGVEDAGGYTQQDGLAAVVQFAASLPTADPDRVGIVSYSYGVTMASGALARHPDLPARYLIDWEGPANRLDTGSCAGFAGPDCTDETYWVEREASTFIGRIAVPYIRVQSAHDHVQPDQEHTLTMVNAAATGNAPIVMLNSYRIRAALDAIPPTWLLPDSLDTHKALTIISHLTRLNAR